MQVVEGANELPDKITKSELVDHDLFFKIGEQSDKISDLEENKFVEQISDYIDTLFELKDRKGVISLLNDVNNNDLLISN